MAEFPKDLVDILVGECKEEMKMVQYAAEQLARGLTRASHIKLRPTGVKYFFEDDEQTEYRVTLGVNQDRLDDLTAPGTDGYPGVEEEEDEWPSREETLFP